VIFALCNENILNVEQVTRLELYLVLTYMCYKQDIQSQQNNNYSKYKE
tara:strand:- start:8690 stop:8833 length:144 start_codon:yes stop_codon:yes gene_type:complete